MYLHAQHVARLFVNTYYDAFLLSFVFLWFFFANLKLLIVRISTIHEQNRNLFYLPSLEFVGGLTHLYQTHAIISIVFCFVLLPPYHTLFWNKCDTWLVRMRVTFVFLWLLFSLSSKDWKPPPPLTRIRACFCPEGAPFHLWLATFDGIFRGRPGAEGTHLVSAMGARLWLAHAFPWPMFRPLTREATNSRNYFLYYMFETFLKVDQGIEKSDECIYDKKQRTTFGDGHLSPMPPIASHTEQLGLLLSLVWNSCFLPQPETLHFQEFGTGCCCSCLLTTEICTADNNGDFHWDADQVQSLHEDCVSCRTARCRWSYLPQIMFQVGCLGKIVGIARKFMRRSFF